MDEKEFEAIRQLPLAELQKLSPEKKAEFYTKMFNEDPPKTSNLESTLKPPNDFPSGVIQTTGEWPSFVDKPKPKPENR